MNGHFCEGTENNKRIANSNLQTPLTRIRKNKNRMIYLSSAAFQKLQPLILLCLVGRRQFGNRFLGGDEQIQLKICETQHSIPTAHTPNPDAKSTQLPTLHKHIISSFFLKLCLLWSIHIAAQSYHYHQYTIEDGLPTDAVYGAMQDSKGYIWIFTEKGVSKFDGYEFKTFTMADGLPSNDVWDLTEDSQGRIWIQTISSKLAYFESDSVKHIKTAMNEVLFPRVIRETTDNNIWFYFKYKVHEVINDSLVAYNNWTLKSDRERIQSLEIPIIWHLLTQPNYYMLFGKQGKFTFKRQKLVATEYFDNNWIEPFADNIANQNRRYFQLDQNQHYLFSSLGVGKWDDNQKKGISFSYKEKLPKQTDNLNTIIVYKNGSDFQCTYGNIFFSVDSDLTLTDTFQLNNFNPRRIFKDKESNLWIVTESDGIFFLTANARNAITYNQNQKILKVIGQKDKIFFSSGNSIYKIQNNNSQLFFEGVIKDKYINGLTFDSNGNLFIGGELKTYKVNIQSRKDVFKKEIWNNVQIKNHDKFPYDSYAEKSILDQSIVNVKDFFWDKKKRFCGYQQEYDLIN